MKHSAVNSLPVFSRTGRRLSFDALPSTNTWAVEHLAELAHGDVVWARRQTGGRGRLGRDWRSVVDGSLTFSVVLRDVRLTPLAANLGQLAAAALLDCLEEHGITGKVKWPNDVMVEDAKVAGVLVEQGQGAGDYIVGVGLNVNLTAEDVAGFGLDRPAVSMRMVSGKVYDLESVLTGFLKQMRYWVEQGTREGLGPLWALWTRHDWLAGRRIRVTRTDGDLEGTYFGVDEIGRLRLRLESGGEERCWTGDVERVRDTGAR